MRAIQLAVGGGVIDEHELDADVALEASDLIRRDVIREIDEDVVGIGRGPGRVFLLLGEGIALVLGRLEVPPQQHDRGDHREPEETPRAATALDFVLVVHEHKYRP